jgi:multidrug transporter EmrE-like cation transporter
MHHLFWYILLIVFISLNFYLFVRGWQALPKNSILYAIYTGIFLFILVSAISAIFFDDNLPVHLGNNLKVIAGY